MDAVPEATVDLEITRPPWGEIGRVATLVVVSGFSKLILNVLNSTKVLNRDQLLEAVEGREPGVGLLTVANHTSTFDDPGLLSGMLPWRLFWQEGQEHRMRWSLCAKEICFKNELLRQFFLNGKTLPILRGEGVSQPVMHTAAARLAAGDWVHLFPEGRIHFSGKLGPFKWGAGKMVCDAKRMNGGRDPMILPFYHSGMGAVLPMKRMVPRVGRKVVVQVGRPLDLSHISCRCNQPGEEQEQVWKDLTVAMHKAVKELEQSSAPNIDQLAGRQVEESDAALAPS